MIKWLNDFVKRAVKTVVYFFGNGGGGQDTSVPSMEQSCLVYWKCDDNSDTNIVSDSSGNNNIIYAYDIDGNPFPTRLLHSNTTGIACRYNDTTKMNFFNFDEEEGFYLGHPYNNEIARLFTAGQDWTVVFWKNVIVTANAYLFYVGDATGREGNIQYYFIGNDTENRAIIGSNQGIIVRSQMAFENRIPHPWHCLVMMYSGDIGQMKLYIDGKFEGAGFTNPIETDPEEPVIEIFIGKWGLIPLYLPLDRAFDDMMIFKRTLTDEEISILWNNGRGTENFQLTPTLNLDGTEILTAAL